MRRHPALALFAAIAVLACTVFLAACGDDNDDNSSSSTTGTTQAAEVIKKNPQNDGVTIKVGSKNFTEQFLLGEIYAQALQAAGYTVKKDLNQGDEKIALKALRAEEIDGYPEYANTALTSFFGIKPQDISDNPQDAVDQASDKFAEIGLKAFDPAPFTSANAVGMLKKKADQLGVTKISDLKDKAKDLTLYGSPECRQRPDCLVGLEDVYGLKFKKFTPVDIGLRYEVLDKGQADASIIFTTDAQLSTRKDIVTLEDDKHVFPPGNPIFIARQKKVDEAGPDFQSTVQMVNGALSEKVMRELNARVDVDRQTPKAVAKQYLKESGYIQ
jgi:glycine betaine/choline ABC-type transport system substrate-binding protein